MGRYFLRRSLERPFGSGLSWIHERWSARLATFRFGAYFISADPVELGTDILHLGLRLRPSEFDR